MAVSQRELRGEGNSFYADRGSSARTLKRRTAQRSTQVARPRGRCLRAGTERPLLVGTGWGASIGITGDLLPYGVGMTTPAPATPPGPRHSDAHADLPRAEFGFPGPLRDRLVAAVLVGAKTATTSLLCEYRGEDGDVGGDVGGDGEPLPVSGARSVVVDSAGAAVAVIETTDVRVVPLAEVDVAHARAEGEGHESVARWRAAHEKFWHGTAMRVALGAPGFTVDDSTEVVLERFRVVSDLRTAG